MKLIVRNFSHFQFIKNNKHHRKFYKNQSHKNKSEIIRIDIFKNSHYGNNHQKKQGNENIISTEKCKVVFNRILPYKIMNNKHDEKKHNINPVIFCHCPVYFSIGGACCKKQATYRPNRYQWSPDLI